jgi:hypothetical protein
MTAVNDLGESFTLAEFSDVNVSNPRIRRAELMTRISGFDKYAVDRGHVGLFVTVTLPSRYHCIMRETGRPNGRFDRSTVREGHAYLCKQWSRLRSNLDRRKLAYYGFRISEPHHDGTPHWHLLLFTEAQAFDAVSASFKKYFNPECEPGERRVTIKTIDRTKGNGVGYIAKYVSKNIDGFAVGEDFEADDVTRADACIPRVGTGESARESDNAAQSRQSRGAIYTATRVDAWASTCGIRQFQQIKGPSVSVWRELRRIRKPVTGVLEEARVAVEEQEWNRFCVVMGGISARTRDRPVQLHTGRGTKPGAYGEVVERQIKGVRAGPVIVPTRLRTWTFTRMPESTPKRPNSRFRGGESRPLPHESRFVPSESSSPWTRVNNCTPTDATRAPSNLSLPSLTQTQTMNAASTDAHACTMPPQLLKGIYYRASEGATAK